MALKTARHKSSVFRFKEFQIDQQDCAMKINTDGVILGAWAGSGLMADALFSHTEEPKFLDVGTGTGVIALMLAQRFADADIVAVEKDDLAANRALHNIQHSPFKDHVSLISSAFEELTPGETFPLGYFDLVVSNPPFFLDSLQNPDARKSLARHAGLHFFQDLMLWSSQLVREEGFFQLILPVEVFRKLQSDVLSYSAWQLYSVYWIYSFPQDLKPVRCLITLQNRGGIPTLAEEKLIIYDAPGQYSEAYKLLLSPFLLDF